MNIRDMTRHRLRQSRRRAFVWPLTLLLSVGPFTLFQCIRYFSSSTSDPTRNLAANHMVINVPRIANMDDVYRSRQESRAADDETASEAIDQGREVGATSDHNPSYSQLKERKEDLMNKIRLKQKKIKKKKAKKKTKSNKENTRQTKSRRQSATDNRPQQQQQQEELAKKRLQKSFIDFISVGSITKPSYQAAQQRTFGSHPAVRNFYPITELNDTDSTCYTDLTMENLETAVEFCMDLDGQSYESALFRKKLRPFQEYRTSTGWLCAQKRPIDGLMLVLERYKTEPVPSYLVIMDDDTYYNMDRMVATLHKAHSPDDLFALSGCTFTFPRELRFNFPYGGFGSILTRKVVQNLMRPIYCNSREPDGFTRMACWRLSQNIVGEAQFFREGISVAELMHSYAKGLPFTEVDSWTNGVGFCFHSDHAIGYFIGYYHVGVPDYRLEKAKLGDTLRKSNDFGYVNIGLGSQCDNEREDCTDSAMICHYVNPRQMEKLYTGTVTLASQ